MRTQRTLRTIEQSLISRPRDRGFRITLLRREIIRILSCSTSHPGALEILRKVKNIVPGISTSTVCDTLDMMKNDGFIRELEYYGTDNRYEINVSDHLNLVCTKCRKMTDFTGTVPSFLKAVERKTGFRPRRTRVEYYGTCRNCSK